MLTWEANIQAVPYPAKVGSAQENRPHSGPHSPNISDTIINNILFLGSENDKENLETSSDLVIY